MIEALPPYAPQKALAVRVGARSVERRPQKFDPGPARYPRKARAELCVVVTDQEPGRLPIGRGFSQLLSHPGISRMASHPNMDDFSALQLDDEEGKQGTKEQVSNWQEVARPDLVRMVVQEGGPRLRRGSYAPWSHVFLDGAFREVNAQFEQFPTDALGSPQTIVQRHRLDQHDGLGRNFGFPRDGLRALPPEPAKRLAMPTQQGIGLDDEERLFPTAGSPCKQD